MAWAGADVMQLVGRGRVSVIFKSQSSAGLVKEIDGEMTEYLT